MTQMEKVAKGLQILMKYNGMGLSAEHDILYSGVRSNIVSIEDTHKLGLLDWYAATSCECWAFNI